MDLSDKKVVVTGGAGFIGSHLVDKLMFQGCHLTVLDNLTSGTLGNLRKWRKNPDLDFVKCDLKDPKAVERSIKGFDVLFHFAANPEVKVGETDPQVHFEENLVATLNLLEAIRKAGKGRNLVYASTSTVYGEAKDLPTPEDYGPTIPISTYGASKQGAEALMSAYANTFNLRALILRFANVIGPRATIGVIIDFIRKLRRDPSHLAILGDGTQKKSYLHIDDCISAILLATEVFLRGNERVDIYNVGSVDQISVRRIANIIVEEMDIKHPEFLFTGGVDGGRGWRGDVKIMHLSVQKLQNIGWRPQYNSESAVRDAARRILGK